MAFDTSTSQISRLGLKEAQITGQRLIQDTITSPPSPTRAGQPFGFDFGFRRGFAFGLPIIGEFPERRGRVRGRRVRRIPIRPSFTGVALAGIGDVFGELPTEIGGLGISPFATRFVPAPLRVKKAKTKKSKAKKKGGKK